RNELMILPQDVAKLGLEPDDFEVALAVRMSISIPYFFMPVKIAEKPRKHGRHWVVDGGLLSNFPIRYFDSPPGETPPWPTFGLPLWAPTAGQPHYERIRPYLDYTSDGADDEYGTRPKGARGGGPQAHYQDTYGKVLSHC